MLGEKLGESSGRVTGVRVLPTEGEQIWLEVSFQGRGQLLGQEITDVGTYRQTLRAGALHGEGHLLAFANNGDVADWVGGGVGKQLGAGFKASFGVYGSFHRASAAFGRLVEVANVTEYEVEEDGAYRWQMWAWTGAAASAAGSAGR